MASGPIPRPDWIDQLDYNRIEHRVKIHRYYLREAAKRATPGGTLRELAAKLGITATALGYTYSPKRGVISPALALSIQKAVGEDVLPAKLLRPDLF